MQDLMVNDEFEYKTVTSQYLNSHARWELEVWTEGPGNFQRKDRDQHEVSTGGERLLPRQQLRHPQRISSGQMSMECNLYNNEKLLLKAMTKGAKLLEKEVLNKATGGQKEYSLE